MRKRRIPHASTSKARRGLNAYLKALGKGSEIDADAIDAYTVKVVGGKLIDPVKAFADLVIAGEIVAGPHVRNACRRHLRDLDHARKRGLEWNVSAALHAIMFFPDVLRLNGGQFEGIPFRLHISQAFRVGSLFGWKRANGTRRFRRFYDEEAKGSGKSPMLAGIGLYCMMADGEARAEIYAAASKKDQAMVLFRDAVAMVDQSPALKEKLTKSGVNPVWNLADLSTASFFRPISDDDGRSGPRPSCALCDEVHEHRSGDTIEMLERGFKWRRQPLLVMATNSGSDRNSVCWQEHQHAVRVAAGTRTPDDEASFVGEVVDDETFSFVCSLDKGDDPLEDPACWVKANPLLGVTVQHDTLASVVRQAKAIPGKLNGILRLHFCVWTDAEEAWMSRSTLEACMADFDEREHVGKKTRVGGDLSATQDLTALVYIVQTGTKAVARERDGKTETLELPTYDVWLEAWTPKDTIGERSLRDQMPYEVWAQGGWLNAIDGKHIRLDFIAARLAEASSDYLIEMIAYDRYAWRKLEDEMASLGLTLPQIEHPQGGTRRGKAPDEWIEAAKQAGREPPQGLWMPGSILALEELILEERIRFKRSPVLMAAMLSAAIEHDAFNNRWFSKRKAVNRIDALVALAMAVGAATAVPMDDGSIYERRGLLVLG